MPKWMEQQVKSLSIKLQCLHRSRVCSTNRVLPLCFLVGTVNRVALANDLPSRAEITKTTFRFPRHAGADLERRAFRSPRHSAYHGCRSSRSFRNTVRSSGRSEDRVKGGTERGDHARAGKTKEGIDLPLEAERETIALGRIRPSTRSSISRAR